MNVPQKQNTHRFIEVTLSLFHVHVAHAIAPSYKEASCEVASMVADILWPTEMEKKE